MYGAWWMHYCNAVQEHSSVVCFTERSSRVGWRVELQWTMLLLAGGVSTCQAQMMQLAASGEQVCAVVAVEECGIAEWCFN